ncbi:BMP family ABC transporter substrate-binding protein [Candidatus Poribacteria bacterium]|nr:MAG: BMP family ABC transporter substrate-binding protein [Candidatus Poribacteria bacterium]
MKQIGWITACLLTSGLILLGCERLDTGAHRAEGKPFKVAMLLSASIDDQGWTTMGYEGLKAIEKELDAEIAYVENLAPAAQEAQFRAYALDGYHLIFGHGYEYQETAQAVAADFPETIFVNTSGSIAVAPNLAPIDSRAEGATYLLGIIAGAMTKSDKIGVLGGRDVPSINSTFVAFEAGAKSVNPDVEVQWHYVGDWVNRDKAKKITLAQIEAGFDFFFHNADIAARGMYEAAEIAQAAGKQVWTFGSNRAQHEVSPTTILASSVIKSALFVHIARDVKNGTFEPKPYVFTMTKGGAIEMRYNPKLKDKVPAAVQKQVAAAEKQILAGTLKVPQIDFEE